MLRFFPDLASRNSDNGSSEIFYKYRRKHFVSSSSRKVCRPAVHVIVSETFGNPLISVTTQNLDVVLERFAKWTDDDQSNM